MSSAAAAAKMMALRFLSGDHEGHSEEDYHTFVYGDHDDAAMDFTQASDEQYDDTGSNAKPWYDVIIASVLIQLVTMIGLVLTSAVNCCGTAAAGGRRRRRHTRFWTVVQNQVIPSFAGGALLATAIFLIIPESLNLVPLTSTDVHGSAALSADVHSQGGYGHEEHHSEDEHLYGEHYEHPHGEEHSEDVHVDRYLQDDGHHDEPDQPWKVGTAILGGFLFPILFWILFPRHGLEDCEQCEVLQEQIEASKREALQEQIEVTRHLSASESMDEGSIFKNSTDDGESDGSCDQGCHKLSDFSEHEGQEMQAMALQAAAPTASVINPIDDEAESPEKATTNQRKPINWGLAASILVGDFFHNFTDGVFLGSAFLVCSQELGYTLVATTVYHELAQEVADFFLLTHQCGLLEYEALALNFCAGFSVLIGALMVLAMDLTDTAKGIVLAISAGVYIHIAASECVPRAQSKCKTSMDAVIFLLCFILGVVPIGLVLLNHGHCEGGGHEGH